MSDERAVSKVVLNGKTLIDITNSTVTNENLLDGEIATGANGRGVVGGIPINTSANLTTSGATVRVPAGYYAEQVSKTIASGSATTPSTEITANPSITVSNSGLITASAAANQSITPTVVAGYVTAGTAGTVTVSGSNTKQLDTSSVVGGTTTVSGTNATRAKATWNRGWIQAGELAAATFANSATSGKTYVDISNTTAAPILVSGNYLYINAGYTDNLKISLAKLVPDGASVDLAEDKMLSGYSAYNNNGQLITGNIPTKTNSDLTVNEATVNVPAGYYATNVSKTISSGSATISGSITTTPTISVSNSGLITASVNGSVELTPTVDAGYITEGTTGTVNYSGSKTQQLTTKAATTFNTSASDQSIAAGTYLTGKQTIKAVTTANISAENIKDGIVVKVGDANSAGRIKNVTGIFTDSSTVSSGQTAATAGQILSGYSAWVDGEEVKGNIATKTASNLTASGKTVTVPAGYYATQVTKDVATAEQATPSVSIDSAGKITATATQTEGYVAAGTKTGTKQLTTKAATTFNTSTSDQTIASGTYLTGKQTIKAVTTSNIDAGNIKDGVTVKVGDANSAGRIKNVTGTFTDSSTVSSGQTAAAAGQMLSGYSAWVDGAEVKGSIATKTASNLTVSGATVTVPAGYYATQVTKDVSSGSATTPATTITAAPTLTLDTTTGIITGNVSKTQSVTPTVVAGYVINGTAGTITINGNDTYQVPLYDGTVVINETTATNPSFYDGSYTYVTE